MSADLTPFVGFDAMRMTRIDGSEYWHARDLMVQLGYDRWENFAQAIERAKITAVNSGYEVADLFRGITKNSGGRPSEDYELARFAAYLVAMNGDPRKGEVARAQQYFAIKTRQAEVQPVPDLSTPAGILAMAEQFTATARALVASEAKVAELAPRAEVADKLLDADGDMSVGDTAKALTRAGVKVGEQRLFSALERRKWIFRAKGDGRWRVYQAAIESGHMSVIPQSHYHPRTGVLVLDPPQVRVTPKGLQRLLLDHGAVVPTS